MHGLNIKINTYSDNDNKNNKKAMNQYASSTTRKNIVALCNSNGLFNAAKLV